MKPGSSALLTAAVATLLAVFILAPIAAVIAKSFAVTAPMSYPQLRAVTIEAFAKIDPETRSAVLSRWLQQASRQQRLEALAVALEAQRHRVNWDRAAAFAEQEAAAATVLARLSGSEREQVYAELAIAHASLHRRVPLAFRLRDSLSPAEFEQLRTGAATGLGLNHYFSVLNDDRLGRAFVNSLTIAVATSFFTVLLAYILAYGVNRRAIPFAGAARYAIQLPIVSPPVIVAFALTLLFGRHGVVTRDLLQDALGLISAEQVNIYGLHGLVIAQILSFVPPAFVVLDNALSRHDGRLEEAAATQGATPWQVFWRVTAPMTQPGIARAFVLVFIMAMTDFGNPEVIGNNFPVLAELIYNEIIGFQNFPLAAALCIWLLLPALAIYLAFELAGRRKRFFTGDSGAPPELAAPITLTNAARVFTSAYVLLIAVLYASVILGSFVRLWGVDFTPTLQHYDPASDIYAATTSIRGIRVVLESAKIVAISAAFGGVFGLIVAYVIERLRPPGAPMLSFLVLLPAVLPGLIFGIGYVIAFNAPFGIRELSLTGTGAILAINILFGHVFVGVLASRAALQRSDPAIDDAAMILGAGLMRRFAWVTAPMLKRALLLGTLYLFLDGMTTLSSIIFLVSPDHQMASARIFSLAGSARYGLACALSSAIIGLVGIAMACAWKFENASDHPTRRRAGGAMALAKA